MSIESKATILVVDDDRLMASTLAEILEDAGYAADTANSGDRALTDIQENRPDLVISDLKMSGMHGHDLQSKIQRLYPDIPVIIITAFGSIETAVESMRRGAFDFLTKPFTNSELIIVVERALADVQLRQELRRVRGELAQSYGLDKIIATSPNMIELLEKVARIADTTASVLLTGESGTGKDLIARALHFQSRRATAPFIPINCAALPDNLLESELFGHMRGAFTDARQNKTGLFQAADKGTLFLDEIGEMPAALQAKLLTVIESKRVRPLGATSETAVDVRVLAATNADLEKEIETGRFRRDLYYRLSGIVLHLPPLRDRREDIPLLIKYFLARAAAEAGRPIPEIAADAMECLLQYQWPGNIRELQNAVQHAVILCRDHSITRADLPSKVSGKEPSEFSLEDAIARRPTLAQLEHDYIRYILACVADNKTEAANILGIDRRTLYRKLEDTDKPPDTS
jgi:two-component system response regulator HydG